MSCAEGEEACPAHSEQLGHVRKSSRSTVKFACGPGKEMVYEITDYILHCMLHCMYAAHRQHTSVKMYAAHLRKLSTFPFRHFIFYRTEKGDIQSYLFALFQAGFGIMGTRSK